MATFCRSRAGTPRSNMAARIPDPSAIAVLTAAVTCRPWTNASPRRVEHRRPDTLGEVLGYGDRCAQRFAHGPCRLGWEIGWQRFEAAPIHRSSDASQYGNAQGAAKFGPVSDIPEAAPAFSGVRCRRRARW